MVGSHKQGTGKRKWMTKVQRLTVLGISGARNNTTHIMLDVVLNLHQLEWYVNGVVVIGALTLRENNLWKPTN